MIIIGDGGHAAVVREVINWQNAYEEIKFIATKELQLSARERKE